MSYLYDRLNRRRVEQPAVSNQEEIPTLEDYSDLLQSYRNLHSRYDQQSAELKAKVSELAIKDEALQRQGSDLKEAEAELLFLRAALQKKQVEGGDESNWQQQFENLQTEMEQVRKRWEQRLTVEVADARNRILTDMLPVADHLEMAVQYARTFEGDQAVAFIGNVESVRRAFLETLRRYGVERIDPMGERFNPRKHEAVGTVKDGGVQPDHIAQVVQVGYVDGDKVLRPARVIIRGE